MRPRVLGLAIAVLLTTFTLEAHAAPPGAAEVNTAISMGKPDRLAELLDQGADPNGRSGLGYTPLMMAAAEGNADAVRVLLAHGADPTLKSNLGTTALDKARGYPAVIKLLQDALAAQGVKAAAPSKLGIVKGDTSGPPSEASRSPYYKTCYPLYGRDLSLCGAGATLCRNQAASRYTTCLKSGRYQ